MNTEISTEQVINADEFIPYSRSEHRLSIENDHDLISQINNLSLVSDRQFKEQLTVNTTDNKHTIYISGDKVKLSIDGNKIIPKLRDYAVIGNKRLIIIQAILKHSDVLEINHSNGWVVYRAVYNNRVLDLGYMEDNMAANFIKLYTPRDDSPSVEEYKQIWYENRNRDHTYTELGNIQLDHKVYGNAETGLGSIITDQIENELLEALQIITQYKDTAVGREYLEIIAELYNTDEE